MKQFGTLIKAAISAPLLSALVPAPAMAAWQQVTGRVVNVSLYDAVPVILFSLDVQSAVPPLAGCSNSSFAVDGSMASDRRQMFLSQLTTALATQTPVIVTWENSGSCVVYDSSASFLRVVRLSLTK